MTHKLMELVSSIEILTVELENLASLLQLYDEHREGELQGVSLDEPYTVAVLLSRQHLGLALLRAIEDKVRHIQKAAMAATDEAYKAARATKERGPGAQT